jgi:hypothetical protein
MYVPGTGLFLKHAADQGKKKSVVSGIKNQSYWRQEGTAFGNS